MIKNNVNLINAIKVDNEFLLDVSITQFNKDFEIQSIINSKKVDISSFQWKLFEPSILKNNQSPFCSTNFR